MTVPKSNEPTHIDTRRRVSNLRTDAREQRQASTIQVVRQTMVNHRQDTGVAQQHFIHAARCRVAVVSGEYVGVQQAAQGRCVKKVKTSTSATPWMWR